MGSSGGMEGSGAQEGGNFFGRSARVSYAPFAMNESAAWVLNFDADMELARPRDYAPKRALIERFGMYIPKLLELIGPSAVVISECSRERFQGPGRAWCMTPRARKLLLASGAEPVAAPSLSVLQTVNNRAFSAALGQTLEGARFVRSVGEVLETLCQAAPNAVFLAKRAFGFSGRGHKRLGLLSAREGGADHAWILASFKAGHGLSLEPFVRRSDDFGLHGYLSRSGELVLGEPTQQVCNAFGAWQASVRAKALDLEAGERDALLEEAQKAAKALWAAGYFGAFGVDAFRWVDEGGRRYFNARSEINARYSMGWAVGMGSKRPDLDER